jgi:hypothetical protein
VGEQLELPRGPPALALDAAPRRPRLAEAIKLACRQFIAVCRSLGLLAGSVVAIDGSNDGSKFRAINTHEKNYTRAKLARRMAEVEASIASYMAALDASDRARGRRGAGRDGAPGGQTGRAA